MSKQTQDELLFGIPVRFYDLDFVQKCREADTMSPFRVPVKLEDKYVLEHINKATERLNRFSERSKQFGPKTIIVSLDI
jgi:hypothetical protein